MSKSKEMIEWEQKYESMTKAERRAYFSQPKSTDAKVTQGPPKIKRSRSKYTPHMGKKEKQKKGLE